MTILDELAAHAKVRVAEKMKAVSPEEMKRRALALPKGDFRFENALKGPDISFICECKKASPSKGLIAPDFPYLQIAKEYEAAGADCISVLTEPQWFLGSDIYLREIAERQAINQFTTAEIKVEMTNNNSISSDQDLDGIVRYLEKAVEDSMYAAAEGVHI